MKKTLTLVRILGILLGAVLVFSCVSEGKFDESLNRLSDDESQIATIKEQIASINQIYPTSISIISSSSVKMGRGKTATIDFRVSPSEATFNYNLSSESCEIELDYLGENTKAGYVTKPSHIKLAKVEQMYDAENHKLVGQYRAYITDLREKKTYDDRLGLVLNVPAQNGSIVQISSSAVNVSLSVGSILSFSFLASENPRILQEDLICEVSGTNISGRIPHLVEAKELRPNIVFEGNGKLVFADAPEVDINGVTDFSRAVVYNVVDEETEEVLDSYEVGVTAFTGLPVMNVYTENDAPIVSKDNYLNAKIEIIDYEKGKYDLPLQDVQIRGRGNSTWSMPKKPYRLKFSEKKQLFGESNGKQWVLLANYSDTTSIRTSTAFYMGELSCLEWTPCSHFVELFINSRYAGTYQLTEQIKVAKDRATRSKDGFVMEIDQPSRLDPDDVYFTTSRLLFCINDPDVEYDSEEYNWVKNYVTTAENALFSSSFLDEETGYKNHIDIESFADWYLINEITKNNDAVLYTSCYVNIVPSGKLKMGPLWDFDISLGNINYNGNQTPDGFWIRGASWFNRMFEDPAFVGLVRERFNYFNAHLDDIYSHINADAAHLKYSVVENNNKWGTWYTETWPNYAIWGAYQNEVEYMKQFLTQRMQWLDDNLPQ